LIYILLTEKKKKKIANIFNTKFLGITQDNRLTWETHIDTFIPKLSSARVAIRAVRPFMSQESLKMVYYSYFHSIMMYGIIFCGNSYYSRNIFRLQKKKTLLDSSWGLEIEILAGNISGN